MVHVTIKLIDFIGVSRAGIRKIGAPIRRKLNHFGYTAVDYTSQNMREFDVWMVNNVGRTIYYFADGKVVDRGANIFIEFKSGPMYNIHFTRISFSINTNHGSVSYTSMDNCVTFSMCDVPKYQQCCDIMKTIYQMILHPHMRLDIKVAAAVCESAKISLLMDGPVSESPCRGIVYKPWESRPLRYILFYYRCFFTFYEKGTNLINLQWARLQACGNCKVSISHHDDVKENIIMHESAYRAVLSRSWFNRQLQIRNFHYIEEAIEELYEDLMLRRK